MTAAEAVARVNSLLADEGISAELVPGQELRRDPWRLATSGSRWTVPASVDHNE